MSKYKIIIIFSVFIAVIIPYRLVAATITNSYSNTNFATVDGTSVNRVVTVPAADFPVGSRITDVTASILFDKQNRNNGSCSFFGNAGGNQDVYNNEIGFRLTSPDSTFVDLVQPNNNYYSGNTRPAYITVTYDDAGTVFPGGTPLAGTYQPDNPLSAFEGSSVIGGNWQFTLTDTASEDPLCVVFVTVTITASNDADISVSKTDLSGSTTYTPGGSNTYQIIVSNAGPIDVENLIVNDPLPLGATSGSWTCIAAAGANCDTGAGTGGINNISVDIEAGSSVTFEFTVTWSTDPSDYLP